MADPALRDRLRVLSWLAGQLGRCDHLSRADRQRGVKSRVRGDLAMLLDWDNQYITGIQGVRADGSSGNHLRCAGQRRSAG